MNSRGLTIVEVLISMAIFFTVTGVYFTFSGLNSSNKANIEKKLASKDVMLQNLIEIKGNPIETLPTAGKCRIRTYKMDGSFVSENIVSGNSNHCGLSNIEHGRIYLLASFLPATVINATFSQASTMKLPSFSSQLLQVDIKVLNKDVNGRLLSEEISFFKR